MSAQSPDRPSTADTAPGRRDALTASPSPAVPATTSPAGGKLPLSATQRTRHRRYRHLGRADRESLHAVLEAGLVAHLGVITGGWPMVVPTMFGFTADTLYLHGSVASQSLSTAGTPVCVTITLTDGLVLARSVFEHTINYRSAMIYGQPRLVTDPAERLAGLRCIAEHVAPGQWDYARQPSRKELAAVLLLALPLDEASVKIRTGPPSDGDSPDAALGLWAGELPLATTWQQPLPDPALPPPASPSLPTSAPAPAPEPTGVPPANQNRDLGQESASPRTSTVDPPATGRRAESPASRTWTQHARHPPDLTVWDALLDRRAAVTGHADNRRVGARLSGRWRASQQSRYGLLDDRLHCIFIHRHLWGERPLLPQVGRVHRLLTTGAIPLIWRRRETRG